MKTINLTEILEGQFGKTRFALMGMQEKEDILSAMKTTVCQVLVLASENAKIHISPEKVDTGIIEVEVGKGSILNTITQITQ